METISFDTALRGATVRPGQLFLVDDDAPTVSVADADKVTEGNDPETTTDMIFTVTLSAVSGKVVTVPFTLTGTATSGADYTAPDTLSVTVAPGDTTASIVIPVRGDVIDEPNETVTVTLGAPTNATVSTVAGAGTASGTITDDEATPTATLALTPASIDESGDDNESTVTATLSGASSQAVTLTVSATPVSPAVAADFTLAGATLTIAAGSLASTGAVTVTAVDNDVDAADKTVTVSATATGGNGVADPASQTLTITDDDERGVTVTPGTLTLDEVDDTQTAGATENQDTYTVALDSQPTGTVTVNLESEDTDIATVAPARLTFTTGNWNTAQGVTVTAVADDADNANDRRTVDIAHTISASGTDYAAVTASPVTVTVADDDGAPVLSIDSPSVTEGDTTTATLTFTVSLAPASGKTVTVNYDDGLTGTAGPNDYTAIEAGTLTFAPGETSSTIAVTVTGDTADEPDETVVLRLSSPTNAALSGSPVAILGTGTIVDNDLPVLSIGDATAAEGDPATFSLRMSSAHGRPGADPGQHRRERDR